MAEKNISMEEYEAARKDIEANFQLTRKQKNGLLALLMKAREVQI